MWADKDRGHEPYSLAMGPELPVTPLLSMEEAARQRAAAIRSIVAAIAEHDFVGARRNSDEEVRLAQVLETLQSDGFSKSGRIVANPDITPVLG